MICGHMKQWWTNGQTMIMLYSGPMSRKQRWEREVCLFFHDFCINYVILSIPFSLTFYSLFIAILWYLTFFSYFPHCLFFFPYSLFLSSLFTHDSHTIFSCFQNFDFLHKNIYCYGDNPEKFSALLNQPDVIPWQKKLFFHGKNL